MATLAMRFKDLEASAFKGQIIKAADILLLILYASGTVSIVMVLIIKQFLRIGIWEHLLECCGSGSFMRLQSGWQSGFQSFQNLPGDRVSTSKIIPVGFGRLQFFPMQTSPYGCLTQSLLSPEMRDPRQRDYTRWNPQSLITNRKKSIKSISGSLKE